MKCPYCGAETKNDVCEFCGSELPKEKTQTTVNITNNYYMSEPSNRKIVQVQEETYKKKAPIWLWVLGWICIFPIPLTILLLRNKKMKPALKYGIIAIAWVVYLAIGISGNSNNSDSASNNNDSAIVTEDTNKTDNRIISEANIETSGEEFATQVFFESDEVVNQFIIDYQTIAGYEMTDITKGNIRQKCFCYAGNCYIEILDSLDVTAISIYFGNCEQDEIMDVTRKCLKVFGASEEEIQRAIDDFTINNDGDYMIEGYSTNSSITCTYVPTKELSKGKSIGRIDIASSAYCK